MKTKKVTYPTGVWVSFGSQGNIIAAGMMPRRELYYSSKLYHLHPGNEVKKVRGELAKAQIVKDLNYLYECPSRMGAALVAKRFGVGFKNCRFV